MLKHSKQFPFLKDSGHLDSTGVHVNLQLPVRGLSRATLVVAVLAWSAGALGQTRADSMAEISAAGGANTVAAADFYVATNGNDSGPGTIAEPFRSVDRARVAVDARKKTVSGRALRVLIRQGTYYLPSTWSFSSQDSGTSTTPIVYANYPGEAPVLSGGKLLTGWTAASPSGWKITLPSGTYFSQLWVNGARRYTPRTTPTGYLRISGEYSTSGSTTQVNQLSYATPPANGVPATMANLGDVELIDFEAWDVPHMRIASVNTATQRITTTASLTVNSFFSGFVPGHRFLLSNVKEALKQPGQFYLDRPTEVLTYLPEEGETLSNTTIIAPKLQKLLTASNLSNVTFQGLIFAHSDWQIPKGGYFSGQADSSASSALTLTNSTNVIFEGDTVEHTGGYGVEFEGAGNVAEAAPYLTQFRDGLITDTGAGGIRVGGLAVCTGSNEHTDANVPQKIYLGNNLITGGGRIAVVGWGILVGDAHDVLVEHNEISDFYSTGVGVGFNWGYACNFAHDDVVQYNSIHNLGQGITNDLGAVYYLTGINSGNKILNNVVHDIDHDTSGGYGGWGLYLDAGASQVSIENNLVYRTTDASLHVNSWDVQPSPVPSPNIFKNNILAYGKMGVMDRHNDTKFLSIVFENNIFLYDKASIQYGYWYCEGKPVCTSYFSFDNNLYFNKSVENGEPASPFFKTPYTNANSGQQPPVSWLTLKQWQAQGEDQQSLFANPLFVNATPGVDNYALQANSPAYGVGFVSFSTSQAGRLAGSSLQAPVNAPAFPLLTTAINQF